MELQFSFIAQALAGRHVPMHAHPALELVYYTKGTGKSTIAEKTYCIQPHRFAIIPPSTKHDQKNNTDVTSICIGVNGWKLHSFLGMWTDRGGILEKPLHRLIEELKHRRPGYALICKGILFELEGLIHRQIAEIKTPPQKGALVEKAIAVIQWREGTLTVSEIARELYVSRDYLRHLFREYAGESPIKYILRARIEKAKELLSKKDLNIGEIAEKCGFKNAYYFTRFYHKFTGQTPTHFRLGRRILKHRSDRI